MLDAKAEKLYIYLTRGTKVTVIGKFCLKVGRVKTAGKTTAVVLVNEIYFSSKQGNKSQQNQPLASQYENLTPD